MCPDCGDKVTGATQFSDWLRSLPGPYTSANYDCQNLDFIWFQYRQGWFITMEEKRHSARSTAAQADTHSIVAQLLATASGTTVGTFRGERPIEYRGHYVLRFENTGPQDSAYIFINERLADNDTLLELLHTGRFRPKI